MNITAIGACDDFHIASIRWDEPKGGIDEMVKIRLQGTTNEIKRMRRVMQKPDATLVAGFQSWQKNFERHVNEKNMVLASEEEKNRKKSMWTVLLEL